jgi:uncharacterized protein (DUF983 family)
VAKNNAQKTIGGIMLVIGFILLGMYLLLLLNGARPSAGMLIIGIVDLVVGLTLLRRAKKASEGMTAGA